MYKTFIRADKAFNHRILGGHWNQTVSRNAGSRLGRAFGTSTDRGTDLFHVGLAVGGAALALGIVKALSK